METWVSDMRMFGEVFLIPFVATLGAWAGAVKAAQWFGPLKIEFKPMNISVRNFVGEHAAAKEKGEHE